jgi:hypothetical protein
LTRFETEAGSGLPICGFRGEKVAKTPFGVYLAWRMDVRKLFKSKDSGTRVDNYLAGILATAL